MFPRSSFDGSTPEEANTAVESKDNGEAALVGALSNSRETPRKATPIYHRFRSFPLDFEPASIVQFLSSALPLPPRGTWLAGLETGHRGNGRFRDSDSKPVN